MSSSEEESGGGGGGVVGPVAAASLALALRRKPVGLCIVERKGWTEMVIRAERKAKGEGEEVLGWKWNVAFLHCPAFTGVAAQA